MLFMYIVYVTLQEELSNIAHSIALKITAVFIRLT